MNTDDPSLRQHRVIQKTDKLFRQLNGTQPSAALSHLKNLLKKTFHLALGHAGILMVTGFVLIGNMARADAQVDEGMIQNGELAGFAPEAIADIVDSVSPYTPNISENKDKVVVAMAMQADTEYLNTPYIFDTQITPEEKVTQPTDLNRTQVVMYTVQQGDTISTIGAKFNLKVASIQYTNDLTNADSIKPGQRLKIPVNDLSDKAVAKAQQKLTTSRQTVASGKRSTVAREGTYPRETGFIVPIAHNGISRGLSSYHTGIDYRAGIGTTVKAAATGKVVTADGFGWNSGWGKTIVVDHGNGRTSRYAHLSSLGVGVGDWVNQGEAIGYSGNTGRSTGPHLHFEVRVGGRPVYPF